TVRKYIGVVHKDAKSDYGVSFPESPAPSDARAQFVYFVDEAALRDAAEITDHALEAPPCDCRRGFWAKVADSACFVVVTADPLGNIIGLRVCRRWGEQGPMFVDANGLIITLFGRTEHHR